MPNPWVHHAGLPPGPAAALAALHLSDPHVDALRKLTPAEWVAALAYCDRARLTPVLGARAREAMPPAMRDRVESDLARNRIRMCAAAELYRSIGERFDAAGLSFIALKGLTHAALFQSGTQPDRMQYDLDLYLPRPEAERAQQLLMGTGWESLEGMETFPTDHLPALVRRTGWEWRGDFFDPEIPFSVELHFQFWNEGLERLKAAGVEEFWNRRTSRPLNGIDLGMLHPADALAYAALHLLKHVLRGSSIPFHIFEIACILDGLAENHAFWTEWLSLHAPELRQLEAVTYRFAVEWFGCRIAPAVRDEIGRLPAATRAWFGEFATSPALREFRPNKDELWLHLSLLRARKDAWQVARRRLLPGNLPALAEHAYIPKSEITWRRRVLHWKRRFAYIASRVHHHGMSLPQTAVSGLRWWWRTGRS